MSYYNSSERPDYIDQIRAEVRGARYQPAPKKGQPKYQRPSLEDARRLFTVERCNRWMELSHRQPEAKMLFGEFWHQGELCVLFAGTNIGKSVLAVQIGESIARHKKIAGFACQAPAERVVYIDFELSAAQFGLRYTKAGDDYVFSDNFFRAQFTPIDDAPGNVDENELLMAALEYKILQVNGTVVIIDNITCLRGGTENATVALALMKKLKALKNDHKLSMLVLAHTPKRRQATPQPISADDLHGSKLLLNFADSAFTMGKSLADESLCYLKQIKQRNTSQRYGDDNVCLCRLQKPGNFLRFKFSGRGNELHHLLPAHKHNRSRKTITPEELPNKVARLAAAGLSQRDISLRLNINLATVNKLIRQGKSTTT